MRLSYLKPLIALPTFLLGLSLTWWSASAAWERHAYVVNAVGEVLEKLAYEYHATATIDGLAVLRREPVGWAATDKGEIAIYAMKWQPATPQGPFSPEWLALSQAIQRQRIDESDFSVFRYRQPARPTVFHLSPKSFEVITTSFSLVTFQHVSPLPEGEAIWSWRWYLQLVKEQTNELDALEEQREKAMVKARDRQLASFEEDLRAWHALRDHQAESVVRIARRDRAGQHADIYKQQGINSLDELLEKCSLMSVQEALNILRRKSID